LFFVLCLPTSQSSGRAGLDKSSEWTEDGRPADAVTERIKGPDPMTSLKGHLILAHPNLLDPNFARAIVLIFDHGKEGAAGVIINRPTEATISDIAEQVFSEPFDWEKSLNIGGPVLGPLMVLHADEPRADQEVMAGLYTTIDAAKVQVLLRNRFEPSLIIANYAGWGPGQLEAEIKEGSWLLTEATLELVFGSPDEEAWATIVREIEATGIPKILGIREVPDDPSMN
jgi:putative transcriptional regulator